MTAAKRHMGLLLALWMGSPALGCSRGGSDPAAPDAGTVDAQAADASSGDPTIIGVAVDPQSVSLANGETRALTATAMFDDGTSQVLGAGLAAWETSMPTIVTVSGDGVATGVAAGTATITVRVGALSATASVTVTGPILTVFADAYGADVFFAPFGGAVNAPVVDAVEAHSGTASLRVEVPAAGYTGGAFKLPAATDLSGFEAVTFWAKASQPASLNVVGFGNDGPASLHAVEWAAVPLTTTWTRHVVPIPLATLLNAETGLFHFAEGPEEGAYTIWLDDIRYEILSPGTLGTMMPAIATESVHKLVGDTFLVNGTSVVCDVGGMSQVLAAARSYYTFTSSDMAVATVDDMGRVTAAGTGTAIVTAKLGSVDAVGALTIQVAPVVAPDAAAPVPTLPATDVLSLFSKPYTNVPVDTWLTGWSNASLTELQIAGDDVKKYANLAYAGIEFFATQSVDASAMTHFHIDLWTPDSTVVRVKLVDFGANGIFGGGDDSEHELSFDAASTPALVTGAWLSLDLPLASFSHLAARAHLAQLILSGSSSTLYVDNLYFHK